MKKSWSKNHHQRFRWWFRTHPSFYSIKTQISTLSKTSMTTHLLLIFMSKSRKGTLQWKIQRYTKVITQQNLQNLRNQEAIIIKIWAIFWRLKLMNHRKRGFRPNNSMKVPYISSNKEIFSRARAPYMRIMWLTPSINLMVPSNRSLKNLFQIKMTPIFPSSITKKSLAKSLHNMWLKTIQRPPVEFLQPQGKSAGLKLIKFINKLWKILINIKNTNSSTRKGTQTLIKW